jgi:hypothetical protein
MNTKLFKLHILIFIMFISKVSFATIDWKTLPQLVHESPTIVKGTISIQDSKTIINISKTLKGKENRQLRVLFFPWNEVHDPVFQDGENVFLFLYVPDPNKEKIFFPNMPNVNEGEMYLYGFSYQAKWPRGKQQKLDIPDSYRPKILDTAPIEVIQDIIEKILRVENTKDVNEKVNICTEYIKSPNKLLQYIALQYVINGQLWSPPGKEPDIVALSHENAVKHIFGKISEEIISLSLTDSNEPLIRSESVRFLRYAKPSVAIPILVTKITDEEISVRAYTQTILNTFSQDLKITGDFVKYKPDESSENLKNIQQKWNNWLSIHPLKD